MKLILFFVFALYATAADHEPVAAAAASSSPLSHTVRVPNTSLRDALASQRKEETKRWSTYLLESHYWWYRTANIAESLGKAFQVATPVIIAINVHYQDTTLQVIGATSATVVLALSGFTNYAKKESAERLANANRIFRDEGVTEMTTIHDANSTASGA